MAISKVSVCLGDEERHQFIQEVMDRTVGQQLVAKTQYIYIYIHTQYIYIYPIHTICPIYPIRPIYPTYGMIYITHTIVSEYISTSSSRASRGRKFQKKKELYSKERICL